MLALFTYDDLFLTIFLGSEADTDQLLSIRGFSYDDPKMAVEFRMERIAFS